MIDSSHIHLLSKNDFFKSYPTLYYGTDNDWFAVITPKREVCALALNSFLDPHRLLRRFQNHVLVEKKISLPEPFSCVLAGTPFQHSVWKALLEIPQGKTWSYQKLALYLKNPKAVRAVANAVGANPISPLIPCHRVIRHNNKIGGYFWGIQTKIKLLKEEGVDIKSFLL